MNKTFLIILLIAIFGFSAWLYRQSLVQSDYLGLPTVSCIDSTLPVIQQYTFHLSINIGGQDYPLSPSISHDPADCLRDIYTNDSSGIVYVKTNDDSQFALSDFFNVWKKNFSGSQIFSNEAKNGHILEVLVNGRKVNTFGDTVILPGSNIEIIYK